MTPQTVSPGHAVERTLFAVQEYDLGATLSSGQAFRWAERDGWWEGVAAGRGARLRQTPRGIEAETTAAAPDWNWLAGYLQVDVNLPAVTASFPDDEPMRRARASCRGLRLLRQDPWECLASFILSSSKQIVQIRQIVAALCDRYGAEIPSFDPRRPARAFPAFERVAGLPESELRGCKMGFRAPYLQATARRLAEGTLNLESLRRFSCAEARAALLELPGVGPKIADCVLLFGYGFPEAFPVDVWVRKALLQLYFPRRRPNPKRLDRFIRTYFGPHSGYAQQYLFHHIRLEQGRAEGQNRSSAD